MADRRATAVVGGGISGLALAVELHRNDVPVTLLEAGATPGGTARTVERDGFLLETGPNSVLDRDGAVQALASRVGVELVPASDRAKRRAVVLGGRLRELPGSPRGMLGSDVLPLSAKLRLLLEPFSRRGAPGVDESLGDFARRHVGRTVTATLIDALQTGIWAGDVERLSAASAFPRLVRLEQAHRSLIVGAVRSRRTAAAMGPTTVLTSAKGGLGSLSLGLARALGDRVQLGAPVRALSRDGEDWVVTTPRATVQAPRVVLAVPTFEAAKILRPLDSGLADALDAFPYTGVAVVQLGFRPALDPDPEGFGFLVPSGERRDILGTLYATSAFPFRAPGGGTLLTVLLGGAHRPDLLERDDAALVAAARAELRALLSVERPPTLAEVFRWPRAIPQYDVGHARRVETVQALAARWPGLWLTGNAYRGAGVADCVRTSREVAGRLLGGE